MASFQNLRVQELMILDILRNVGGFKNMSRQQLESIFTGLSLPKPTNTCPNVDGFENMSRQQPESVFTGPSWPKPTPKPALRPKNCIPTPALRPKKHSYAGSKALKTYTHLN